MKKSITFLVHPLAVIAMSMFVIVGCSDDDDELLNGGIPGTVTDIDNNVYQTVIIGDQEWMAENLRVTRYNNGDPIPTGLSDEAWGDTAEGAFAIFDHNHEDADGIASSQAMVKAYGKLYNWFAVVDSRGLCPEGWRVPSDYDWSQLVDFVVAQGYQNDDWTNPNAAGNALKSCRQVGSPFEGCNTSEHPRWASDNTHYGFDEFGFSALPGGLRGTNGSFLYLGATGWWWSSTEYSSTFVFRRYMNRDGGKVYLNYGTKTNGLGLRCVRGLE